MEMNAASTSGIDELSLLESRERRRVGFRLRAANRTGIVGKDDVVREYEALLAEAEWFARFVGFLYAASRFIGYCNLTWATVVVLGGFCSDLHPSDLWSVSALLLAEAALLASATFFSILRDHSPSNLNLHLIIATTSHRPLDDLLVVFARSVTFLSRFSSFYSARLFSFLSQYGINLAVALVAGRRTERLDATYSDVDTARNFLPALFLFYRLLVINVALNMLTISADHSAIASRGQVRYYEYVLEKLLRGSLGLADPVDFFDFAYVTVLGREFQHNVKTDVMVEKYGKMLEYLHAHRQGFDHLFVYLEYGDASVQQAAANLPGLWMSLPTTRAMVKSLPEGLVSRLLGKLPDSGEVGRAAANSLGAIAANGKGDLLLSFGTKVGDALAAAVDPRTSRSLVLVRALVFLVHGQVDELSSPPMPSSPELSMIFSVDTREQLEKVLESLLRDARLHRLRALSAYLLFLLGRNPTLILPEADPFLGIVPTSDRYWLSREKEMLEQLYDRFRASTGGRSGMPEFPVIDEDGELSVPVWAQAVS